MHGAVSFHGKYGLGKDEEISERLKYLEGKINQFGGNLLLWILSLIQKFFTDYYILEILLGSKT